MVFLDNIPGHLNETTGGSSVECCPALIVTGIDVSAMLNKELHHIHIVIYAGLQKHQCINYKLFH